MHGFKALGKFMVFFSHQRLFWDQAGSDTIQFNAMTESLKILAARLQWDTRPPSGRCYGHRRANIQTYKSRVWTRAEQMSFSTTSGVSKMFTTTADFGEVPESWMADLAALLEGAPATRRA